MRLSGGNGLCVDVRRIAYSLLSEYCIQQMSFELRCQDRVQMTQLAARRKRNVVNAAGTEELSQWRLPQDLRVQTSVSTVEEGI